MMQSMLMSTAALPRDGNVHVNDGYIFCTCTRWCAGRRYCARKTYANHRRDREQSKNILPGPSNSSRAAGSQSHLWSIASRPVVPAK